MRAPFVLVLVLALALGPAGVTGCNDGRTRKDDAVPAAPAGREGDEVTLRLEVPGRARYGERVTAKASLVNATSEPVMVESFALWAGSTSIASVGSEGFEARRDERGRRIVEGTYLVEDLGPVARAPGPPRWEWAGTERLVTGPVIVPTASLTISGAFEAIDETGGRVEARVRLRRLPRGTALLKVTGYRREPVVRPGPGPAPGGPPSGKYVAVAREWVVVEPSDELPAGTEPLAPDTEADLVPVGPGEKRVYRFFVALGTFERLEVRERSGAAAVAIERPAYDLAEARARCGFPVERYAYLADPQAWALESPDGRACLAAADRHVALGGRLIPLVERLNESGRAAVAIYRGETEPPRDTLARKLAERGVSVRAEPEKGGTFRGVAEVTPADVFAFLEELAARGRWLDGLEVVPAR